MKYDYKYLPKKIVFDYAKGFPFRMGMFWRKLGLNDKRFEKLKSLKNLYLNQECFIVGTGPSLRIEDLDKIKEKVSFSMNSICDCFELTGFRPTFYGFQDPHMFRNYIEKVSGYGLENILVAIGGDIKLEDCKDEWILFPFNHYYNSMEFSYGVFDSKFSKNAYSTVYDGYTITFSLMQIAYYMGFRTVYLLGVDCNYTPGQNSHFIETDLDAGRTVDPSARMYEAYRAAKIFAEANGFKIYNATRGGKLDLFERVNFDDIV